ncbi:MAG: sensor histidine kinase, partial [Bacillota bacterium]|nr:sensor histidine kinase [Bacillota bacterium]
MSWISDILKYLYCRKGILILYLTIFIFLFLLAFIDYFPLRLVADAMLLSGFCLLAVLLADGISFIVRYHRLMELKENIHAFPDELPTEKSCLEKLYLEIIQELYDLLEDERGKAQRRKREMSDYYTMWVHQIKTPISGLDLALQSGETDSAIAKEELFKIRQYVDMALDYTKLEDLSGDLVLERRDIDDIV